MAVSMMWVYCVAYYVLVARHTNVCERYCNPVRRSMRIVRMAGVHTDVTVSPTSGYYIAAVVYAVFTDHKFKHRGMLCITDTVLHMLTA